MSRLLAHRETALSVGNGGSTVERAGDDKQASAVAAVPHHGHRGLSWGTMPVR